ncbi:MAG: NAD(P)-dependent oxidoreductase [Candidatus Nitrosopolaris sp.]
MARKNSKDVSSRLKSLEERFENARGSLDNERHLIEALRRRWLAGAGLDVFEKEPPSPNNPLLKMKNVVLLPHIGSATFSTRTKMAEVAAKNLLNVLNGTSPIYLANPAVVGK